MSGGAQSSQPNLQNWMSNYFANQGQPIQPLSGSAPSAPGLTNPYQPNYSVPPSLPLSQPSGGGMRPNPWAVAPSVGSSVASRGNGGGSNIAGGGAAGSLVGSYLAQSGLNSGGVMSAADAGASAAEGAGAAGGSIAGTLAAYALPAAVAAAGYFSPPISLGGDYWTRMNNQLTGQGSGNSTYDQYTPASMQRANALQQLMGMMGTKWDNGGGSNVMGGGIPGTEWQWLGSQGITPQNIQQKFVQTENPQMYAYMQANPSLFNWGSSGTGIGGGGPLTSRYQV